MEKLPPEARSRLDPGFVAMAEQGALYGRAEIQDATLERGELGVAMQGFFASKAESRPRAIELAKKGVEANSDDPIALLCLSALHGQAAASLLLPNDEDLTFAKVRLDDASAAAVPALLPRLADPLARAVVWTSTMDSVRDGERPVEDLVELMVAALPVESEIVVVEDVLTLSRALIDRYLDGDARADALARVAGVCAELVAEPVSEAL